MLFSYFILPSSSVDSLGRVYRMLGIGSLGTLHADELALWVYNILFLFPGNISQPLLSLVSCRRFVLCFLFLPVDWMEPLKSYSLGMMVYFSVFYMYTL